MQDIFATSPAVITGGDEGPRLTTVDMLLALVEREDGPWDRFWGEALQKAHAAGKALRGPSMGLAGILKPYGIMPKKIRVDEETSKQGYVARDFEDAWNRYAPPSPQESTSRSERRNNSSETTASGQNEVGTDDCVFRPENARQPLQDNDCSDVPSSDPLPGGYASGKGSPGPDGSIDNGVVDRKIAEDLVRLQDVLPREAPLAPKKPTGPCHACGARQFWLTPSGLYRCQRCHPAPSPLLVRAEYEVPVKA
jgi:hypothetical protein